MKKINFLIIISFLLASCSGLKEAGKIMRNEKVKNSDEFLVKKRDPLVLPPDYNEIPVPGSKSKTKNNEEDKIKKILNVSKEEKTNTNKTSSTEDSILNRIRK
jgi:hypothetical protein